MPDHNLIANAVTAPIVFYEELKSFGVPFARSHMYVLMREGKFPQAMKLTENKIAWIRTEVEQWVQDKIDAHRQAQAGVPA